MINSFVQVRALECSLLNGSRESETSWLGLELTNHDLNGCIECFDPPDPAQLNPIFD